MNSRLDALQAAILRVKMKHLDKWAAARQRNADRYRELFREFLLETKVKLPIVPLGLTHVYNQFTIRSGDRDNLRDYLHARGIPSEIYYPIPLHLQKAFAYLGHKVGDSQSQKPPVGKHCLFPYIPNSPKSATTG